MDKTVHTPAQGWHIAQWGALGWAETAIKGIGIVMGWIAFISVPAALEIMVGGNPRLAAIGVLAFLTLPTLILPVVRIGQKEIVSLIYALCNLTGHVALLIALLRAPELRGFGIVFGVCYGVGELIKQRFLATSGYTETGATTAMMVNLSRALMAFYVIFAVLLLI